MELPFRGKNDEALTEFIRGKKVCIVGPAPYLQGLKQGSLIDEHDVVIRINNGPTLATRQPEDYGSRTDVVYINLRMQQTLLESPSAVVMPDSWFAKFTVFDWEMYGDIFGAIKRNCGMCGQVFEPETIVGKLRDAMGALYLVHKQCIFKNCMPYRSMYVDNETTTVGETIAGQFTNVFRQVIPESDTFDFGQSEFTHRAFDAQLGSRVILDIFRRKPALLTIRGFDFYGSIRTTRKSGETVVKRETIYAESYPLADCSDLGPTHKDETYWQRRFFARFFIDTENTVKIDDYLKQVIYSDTASKNLKRIIKNLKQQRQRHH